jgi:hypothetical protein
MPPSHTVGREANGFRATAHEEHMVYISKKKRERAYYVTGIDALDHICKVDGCDRKNASPQLAAAHVDGEARIIYASNREPLPATREFWKQAWIQLSTGMVLHDRSDSEVREAALKAGVICYRQILVRREDLEGICPSDQRRKESSPIGSASATQPELLVRRPASEDDILRAARALYRRPGKPPNQREAEQQLMAEFPRTSREYFIRPILRRQEFADLRLKRGNQRKT